MRLVGHVLSGAATLLPLVDQPPITLGPFQGLISGLVGVVLGVVLALAVLGVIVGAGMVIVGSRAWMPDVKSLGWKIVLGAGGVVVVVGVVSVWLGQR